jgi:hypothetical protein
MQSAKAARPYCRLARELLRFIILVSAREWVSVRRVHSHERSIMDLILQFGETSHGLARRPTHCHTLAPWTLASLSFF